MNNIEIKKVDKVENAIEGLEKGSISSRLVYLSYLILGILFLLAASFTLYGLIMVIKNNGIFFDLGSYRAPLFILYILMNIMVSYGFIYCRSWVVTLVASNVALLGIVYVLDIVVSKLSTVTSGEVSVPGALILSGLLLIYIYLTRHFIVGEFYRKKVVLPYLFILLISFSISYFNLL